MADRMITIDGAQGEGGGQVLRTSLALAMVSGTPFRLTNIRAGRKKPGLARQHLVCVEAARTVSDAGVEGAKFGSQSLVFSPGKVRAGEYHFAVGTAGSTTLVLQTVLPALVLAEGPSSLIIEGGTHNPFTPPVDFIATTFLPLLNRMGPEVSVTLDRPGFFPAGGGRIEVKIQPCDRLLPLNLMERDKICRIQCQALISRLPAHIAGRELAVVERRLRLDKRDCQTRIVKDSPGPGNALIVEVAGGEVTEIFTGFGKRRVSAEEVANLVVEEVLTFLKAGVPVGEHLADQLLVPLALAGGGRFRTSPLSSHTRTNASVIQQIIGVQTEITACDKNSCEVALISAP